jgi:hydroxymethylglutaryl-CoA reductase (NADPH)
MATHQTRIPTRWIGPISCNGSVSGEISVPMATYETTLWPSTARGAKISRLTDGINVSVISDCMTRSVALQASNASSAHQLAQKIQSLNSNSDVIKSTSAYAALKDIFIEQVGPLLYIRISINPAQASGHNMATKAADALIADWLQRFDDLKYVSISANTCVDKKVSAINGILGRGKKVIAEIIIPRAIASKHLHTDLEKIHDLNTKKNYIGSIIAGSTRSANAHYANALLALYLATGQDAANIVEGSQGITYTEINGDELYFSVTIPNIIVGTVGNGKASADAAANLEQMQCTNDSTKLAAAIGATVLCSELSLMAAQTRPGELTRSHMVFERNNEVIND